MKKIKLKVSSVIAKSAIFRNGAGQHRDQKQHANKYACRSIVDEDETLQADTMSIAEMSRIITDDMVATSINPEIARACVDSMSVLDMKDWVNSRLLGQSNPFSDAKQ